MAAIIFAMAALWSARNSASSLPAREVAAPISAAASSADRVGKRAWVSRCIHGAFMSVPYAARSSLTGSISWANRTSFWPLSKLTVKSSRPRFSRCETRVPSVDRRTMPPGNTMLRADRQRVPGMSDMSCLLLSVIEASSVPGRRAFEAGASRDPGPVTEPLAPAARSALMPADRHTAAPCPRVPAGGRLPIPQLAAARWLRSATTMWIVRLALRRPYTFIVMAMLIAIGGVLTIARTPVDIFPEINIPVISIIWQFTGLSPNEVEGRMVTISERAMTTTVNSIEHIESQSLAGVGLIRVFFHPDASIGAADAEVTAINQTLLRSMPPGTTPPLIIRYSASNVPILQLALQSPTLSEQQLYDYGLNFIRTQLATVQGAQVPLPWGGKVRSVMVDLDPDALYAKGLSAFDVSSALGTRNVILPAGTAKIGPIEYNVRTNSSPDILETLNDLPVSQVGGATVYMRDVAQVRDGFAVQTNMVHVDGRLSALLAVLKTPTASTLDIVQRVKNALPRIQATLPPELGVKPLFDQSVFVRASLQGVLREAIIAAALTGLMILLFLGSWRSTLVIVVSIPLAILVSVITLSLFGETLNVMTLGGLALAVGILVDDATVEIENIHRNLAMGKPIIRAILDGAQQIAVPAFVSTLAICIVFVPVVFLKGAVQFLFTPMALAVVLAMLASYFLSRTLVPTMVQYLLKSEVDRYSEEEAEHQDGDMFWRIHDAFNRRFVRLRE